MSRKRALFAVAVALAACVRSGAQAQLEPAVEVCEDLGVLDVAWQNFENQDVNASLEQVTDMHRQLSAALDRNQAEARAMSPAAFDRLRDAHATVQAAIDAIPDGTPPEQIEDALALPKDNERFAYQNFRSNIACPVMPGGLGPVTP